MVRQNKYPPIDELLRAWRNIYEKYGSVYIELIGGEPFIYPHFIELIKGLSQIHTLGITTNLSVDLDNFIEQVDSSRVKICPTFHPLFADFERFIRRTLQLKDKGMTSKVVYLAYPPQIKLVKHYAEEFIKQGFQFSLLTFWGKYHGITYPEGYTQEEKELIKPYLGDVEGEKFQLEPKKVKGRLCRAGQIYANIKADGSVFRCGGAEAKLLNNLFSDDFELLDKPLPCESEFCPCNEWAFLLDEKITTQEKEGNRIISLRKNSCESFNEVPKFPRKDPPYRVYWNWDITYECNYRCSYCIFWKDYKERYPSVENDRWKDIWNNIFEKYWCCHIRFSGGEPFIYPNFLDLIAILSEKHTVDVTTNLTFDMNLFLERVKPDGITLSASFHPEFVGIDEFLDKVLLLNKKEFPTSVAYVAYPPHLADLERYKSTAERRGVLFKIIPFIGEFEGKKYPDNYDSEQKKLLEEAAVNTENQSQKELNAQWFNQNTDKKSMQEKLCRMGQMYAKILPSGEVTRCCHYKSDKLGSIFDKEFRLLDEPAVCKTESCPCWKPMIVGYREDKYPILWEMPEHKVYKLKKS